MFTLAFFYIFVIASMYIIAGFYKLYSDEQMWRLCVSHGTMSHLEKEQEEIDRIHAEWDEVDRKTREMSKQLDAAIDSRIDAVKQRINETTALLKEATNEYNYYNGILESLRTFNSQDVWTISNAHYRCDKASNEMERQSNLLMIDQLLLSEYGTIEAATA